MCGGVSEHAGQHVAVSDWDCHNLNPGVAPFSEPITLAITHWPSNVVTEDQMEDQLQM